LRRFQTLEDVRQVMTVSIARYNGDSLIERLGYRGGEEAVRRAWRVQERPPTLDVDWIELPVGAERDFMGYRGRWMRRVHLPKSFSAKENGSTAYQPTTVHRASRPGLVKGQTVFILDDPNGTPWIMQGSVVMTPWQSQAGSK
jgi:hypothetical protein